MNNVKSITFLMPSKGSKGPAGGFKVVYEYANRLAQDGFKVHIVYPVSIQFSKYSLAQKFRVMPRLLYWLINGFSCRNWFPLNKFVREHLTLGLNQKFVPKTDFYVATGVKTSYYLYDYKRVPCSNKLYLIQDYESWGVSDEYVNNSYRLGLKNIAISNWLYDKILAAGGDAVLIPNGFDFDYFRLLNPIVSRSPLSISMLYHHHTRKGCRYGIEALEKVKKKYPELKVRLFGTPYKPDNLPSWIEYYQRPDKETHNRIYNESAIYLAPSLQEGWGLPVGEAMICGAAIICTDTLGFREMVDDRITGMICPTADSESLATAICQLIENNELRMRLAKAGNSHIQSFTWDNSYNLFKSLLND